VFYFHSIDILNEKFPEVGKGRLLYGIVKGKVMAEERQPEEAELLRQGAVQSCNVVRETSHHSGCKVNRAAFSAYCQAVRDIRCACIIFWLGVVRREKLKYFIAQNAKVKIQNYNTKMRGYGIAR